MIDRYIQLLFLELHNRNSIFHIHRKHRSPLLSTIFMDSSTMGVHIEK